MTPPIRIVLADDHRLVRAGIGLLLQRIGGTEVVAEADDGQQTVDCVREHRPHVVFMDIGMQGLNGIDAAERIRREFPDVRVIMLSMSSSVEHVTQALRAGAAGYLLKDVTPEELANALQAVVRGEVYLTPSVSRKVVDGMAGRRSGEALPMDALTSRQREILQLLAEGHATKEIAFRLGLSAKTVEAHRAQIMERLEIRDVPGLVRYAIRTGLVSPER